MQETEFAPGSHSHQFRLLVVVDALQHQLVGEEAVGSSVDYFSVGSAARGEPGKLQVDLLAQQCLLARRRPNRACRRCCLYCLLHVDVHHLGVQVGRNSQARQVAPVLLRAAGRQELAHHVLHLLLVGGLPEDERQLGVVVDPGREALLAEVVDAFVEDVEVAEALAVVAWVKGAGCA